LGFFVTRSLAVLVAFCFLLPVLGACGEFFDDDGDGEPFVVVTDQGQLAALSGGLGSYAFLWEGSVAPSARASIVSDGNSLYVGSGQEVSAFAEDSGEVLGSAPLTLGGEVVALAGPGDDAVYAMTLDGTLAAIETSDGSLRWTQDLLQGLTGASFDALLFAQGALVLGGDPIRSLSPADGSVQATYPSGDSYVTGMHAIGGTLYAGLADGVVALSLGTLGELWKHPTDDEVDNLAVGSTTVFYSVVGQGVGALTLTGNPVGEMGDDGVFEALAIGANLLLAARSDATLFAWDEASLEEVWSDPYQGTPVRGLVTTSLSAFYANSDIVYGVNLENGNSLWFHTGEGNPVGLLAL